MIKRTVIFIDENRNKVSAECEITTRNGYPEFSMSGDMGGSCGQIFDSVKPGTDAQHALIDMWKEWHLNGMSAGTPEQNEALNKEEKRPEFKEACEILKKAGKFEVKHPETGEPFKYGHGWYTKRMPEGFEENLTSIMDEIEEENNVDPVTEDHNELFEDFTEPEACLALAIMLELNIGDIEDISENGNYRYCVQGVDYLCGTDDEMELEHDEEMERYIDECVLPEVPESVRIYFDNEAWKRDARINGSRSQDLNRWDGSELNEGDYYAYRQ